MPARIGFFVKVSFLSFLAISCATPDPTSVLVTVQFDDTRHMPDDLLVTVSLVGDGGVLKMDKPVTPPVGRPVRSGDTFEVLLRDDMDGRIIAVDVTAVEQGAHTISGHGT